MAKTMEARAMPNVDSLSGGVDGQLAGIAKASDIQWHADPDDHGAVRGFLARRVFAPLAGKYSGTDFRHHKINGTISWDMRPLSNIINQLLFSIRSNSEYDDRTKMEMERNIKLFFKKVMISRAGAVRNSFAAKRHIEWLNTSVGHQLEGPFDYRIFTFDHLPIYKGLDEQMWENLGNIVGMSKRTFDLAMNASELKLKGAIYGMSNQVASMQALALPGYFGDRDDPKWSSISYDKLFESNVRLELERIGREVYNTLGALDQGARVCKVWNPVLNTWMQYPNIHTAQRADAATWDKNADARKRYAEELVYDRHYLGKPLAPVPEMTINSEGKPEVMYVRDKRNPDGSLAFDPTTGQPIEEQVPPGTMGARIKERQVTKSDVLEMKERLLRAQQLMGGGPSGMAAARDVLEQLCDKWQGNEYGEMPPISPRTRRPVIDPETGRYYLDPQTRKPVIDPATGREFVDPITGDPLEWNAVAKPIVADNSQIIEKLNKVLADKQSEMLICLEAEARKRQANVSGDLTTKLTNNNPWYQASTYGRIARRILFLGIGAKLAASGIAAVGTTGGFAGWAGATVGGFFSTGGVSLSAAATAFMKAAAAASGLAGGALGLAVGIAVAAPVIVGGVLIARNLWRGRQWNRVGRQIARNLNSARDIVIEDDSGGIIEPGGRGGPGGGPGGGGGGGGYPLDNPRPPSNIWEPNLGTLNMLGLRPRWQTGPTGTRYEIYGSDDASMLPTARASAHQEGVGNDHTLVREVRAANDTLAKSEAEALDTLADVLDTPGPVDEAKTLAKQPESMTGNVTVLSEFRDRKNAAARKNGDARPVSPTATKPQKLVANL